VGFFRRKEIRDLAEGHATIVDCWKNVDQTDGNCRMKLDLDNVPGVERQVVDHHELMMSANRWPEVGMVVAVTVNRNRPDDVDVHWESVFGEIAGGALGRAAELAGGLVGIDMDLSKGVPSEYADQKLPDDEIPARVAELNAQFARGEITYEEMADQIRRALGT
jgi:hypothetical protein